MADALFDDWSDDAIKDALGKLSLGRKLAPPQPGQAALPAPVAKPLAGPRSAVPAHSFADRLELGAHLRKHQRRGCNKCKAARCWSRWRCITTTRGTSDRAGKSWLLAAPLSQKPWGIGCQWCHAHYGEAGGRWSRLLIRGCSLQVSCLLNHQASRSHKQAASHALGDADDAAVAAPATEEFCAVLDALQGGKLPPQSRLRKTVGIGWCLYEAVRDQERMFLQRASVLSIMQDAHGSHVLTRYAACSSNTRQLEVRRGILTLIDPGDKPANSGAQSLSECVRHGIRALATQRVPHPGMRPPAIKPSVDVQLAAQVRRHIEMFIADGAADEQLAGRLLSDVCNASGHKIFPRLGYILRDKPHASRRLLQRTWCKDEFLAEIQDRFLFRKYSVAKLLQHSHVLKHRFQSHQAADTKQAVPVLRDMSFAKQHFDSAATPLARMVLCMDDVLQVLTDVIRERRGTPPFQATAELLDVLSDEMLLQLGMVAACSDEVLTLTRFLDRENYEAAELPRRLRECT